MRGKIAILAAVAVAAVALVLVLVLSGGSDRDPQPAAVPGEPTVDIVSPRNGARQSSHAVVVKVEIRNFKLAPRHFGGEPQLGEGHIRFGLNRVPNCVNPAKLEKAIESPFGKGRLVGRLFRLPRILRSQRGAG